MLRCVNCGTGIEKPIRVNKESGTIRFVDMHYCHPCLGNTVRDMQEMGVWVSVDPNQPKYDANGRPIKPKGVRRRA